MLLLWSILCVTNTVVDCNNGTESLFCSISKALSAIASYHKVSKFRCLDGHRFECGNNFLYSCLNFASKFFLQSPALSKCFMSCLTKELFLSIKRFNPFFLDVLKNFSNSEQEVNRFYKIITMELPSDICDIVKGEGLLKKKTRLYFVVSYLNSDSSHT